MTSESTAEDRLSRLEDRFAIMDLVAAYCAAIDGRDLDGFVGCFTADGVIRHADYGVTFHYPHSHAVVIDGPDAAHGTVTAHAEMALDGEAWLAAFRYADTYRREDGAWRFADRELACWYYMPLSQLSEGMASHLRKHYRGELIPAELPESLASYKAWHTDP
jgi:hypothetical protein